MPTVSVLGSSGMLGAGIVDYLSSRNFQVIEINRLDYPYYQTSNHIRFDAANSNVTQLARKLPGDSTVINCTGVIKHKIDNSNPETIQEAIKVNSVFPNSFSNACMEKNISIIQIATDCVFSGKAGNYSELSKKDAQDIYGLTKSAGEVIAENVMNLRCSLVGRERSNHLEFLDWVLSHPKGGVIHGFTNHFWNGVTVLDIAKFVEGSITQNFFKSGIHHFVPSDSMSKYELIQQVCSHFERGDLKITEVEAPTAVNRVLVTSNLDLNAKIWNLAQYNKVPTISEMLANYALWIKKNR